MQVIYSSKTGNTQKLAQAIASELNVNAISASEVGELKDTVVLGFWCDKGQIDETAAALLPKLYGKQVALFYSAGVEQTHEYVAQMNAQFAKQLRDSGASVIAPVFMSQGAISEEIIQAMKAMAAANPNDERHAITPEKEARWSESKLHPSEDDLASARKWASSLSAAASQLKRALDHMNDDHLENVGDLCVHAGHTKEGAKLVAIDFCGLGIECADGYFWLDYKTPVSEPKQLHMSVIELCVEAKPAPKASKLEEDLLAFRRSFASCVIASLRPDGTPLASYAPVIEHEGALYAFISEVADHYEALVANNQASIMFVQDEAAAAMVFARVRLRYEVKAEILERDGSELETALFSTLAAAHSGGEVAMFKAMKDFHFVRLNILGGRYVKGFGAAFDIDENGKVQAVRVNNPHKK